MRHKLGSSGLRLVLGGVWVAGLAAYRLIPDHRLASGALTGGLVVLMVLKHVGFFSVFGAPVFAFFRAVLSRLHRRRPVVDS